MTLWPEAARAREGLRAYFSDAFTDARSFDLGQNSRSNGSLSGRSVAPRFSTQLIGVIVDMDEAGFDLARYAAEIERRRRVRTCFTIAFG